MTMHPVETLLGGVGERGTGGGYRWVGADGVAIVWFRYTRDASPRFVMKASFCRTARIPSPSRLRAWLGW
jgi:hypothetical protein